MRILYWNLQSVFNEKDIRWPLSENYSSRKRCNGIVDDPLEIYVISDSQSRSQSIFMNWFLTTTLYNVAPLWEEKIKLHITNKKNNENKGHFSIKWKNMIKFNKKKGTFVSNIHKKPSNMSSWLLFCLLKHSMCAWLWLRFRHFILAALKKHTRINAMQCNAFAILCNYSFVVFCSVLCCLCLTVRICFR